MWVRARRAPQIFDPADDKSPSAETVCRLAAQRVGSAKGNTTLHQLCLRDGTKGTPEADLAAVRLLLRAGPPVNTRNDKGWCVRPPPPSPPDFLGGPRSWCWCAPAQCLRHTRPPVCLHVALCPLPHASLLRTPLHYACVSKQTEIARLLLAHGAVVNEATVAGLTPLHFAMSVSCEPIARLLICHGAE